MKTFFRVLAVKMLIMAYLCNSGFSAESGQFYTKEHLVIIHPIAGAGDPFKYLGTMMDCKLIMHQANVPQEEIMERVDNLGSKIN